MVSVSVCGPGSWAEVEMVTLWKRLSEFGCPQKPSLRQGLGARGPFERSQGAGVREAGLLFPPRAFGPSRLC